MAGVWLAAGGGVKAGRVRAAGGDAGLGSGRGPMATGGCSRPGIPDRDLAPIDGGGLLGRGGTERTVAGGRSAGSVLESRGVGGVEVSQPEIWGRGSGSRGREPEAGARVCGAGVCAAGICRAQDLPGQDLQGRDLRGGGLHGRDLQGGDLRAGILQGRDLQGWGSVRPGFAGPGIYRAGICGLRLGWVRRLEFVGLGSVVVGLVGPRSARQKSLADVLGRVRGQGKTHAAGTARVCSDGPGCGVGLTAG
jgi:hypothetical protein